MSLHLRLMNKTDIPAGMRLVAAAGWNQTEADWERFLNANPEGCFVAEWEGQVCGTVTTIVYDGRLAWIGMVLVSPERRSRGIGAQLLKTALERLESLGSLTIKLDATPEGKPLYQKLGFAPEHEIERLILEAPGRRSSETKGAVWRAVEDDSQGLEEIIATDRKVFGAGREALLQSLHRDAPEFTAAVRIEGGLAGYTLGRRGLHADHLGPWMARDQNTARQLLEEFLKRSGRERVVADCIKSNPFAGDLLRSQGFACSRRLTRMVRGTNAHPGQPELLCAILGPEFG